MSKLRPITCECETEVACCTALNTEPIDIVQAEDLAEAFHALGDPYRMAIVHLIAATGEAGGQYNASVAMCRQVNQRLLRLTQRMNDHAGIADGVAIRP